MTVETAKVVRDAIAAGRLEVGEKLPTERALAQMLGVSRATVRDAVKVLKGMGLVTVRHGSGIYVAAPEDPVQATKRVADALLLQKGPISDLFEIREVLETEAVAWATRRANRQEMDNIDSVYTEYKHHADTGKLSSEEANRYDSELHRLIAIASRNLVLVQIMDHLRILLNDSRNTSISVPGRLQKSVEEMGRIVAALEQGAVEDARSEMLAHLGNGKKALAAYVRSQSRAQNLHSNLDNA